MIKKKDSRIGYIEFKTKVKGTRSDVAYFD